MRILPHVAWKFLPFYKGSKRKNKQKPSVLPPRAEQGLAECGARERMYPVITGCSWLLGADSYAAEASEAASPRGRQAVLVRKLLPVRLEQF